MKGIAAGVVLVVASSLATTQAADRVDAAAAAPVRTVDAPPDARAIEDAMADAFRASDGTARECSDRWSAYCDIADHAAGAVMMQAREKYEAAEFVRDR